jgi:LmbE family N-acetylglucosaminyl deacetylase
MRKFIEAIWRRRISALKPCPLPSELELPPGARVLVVAPHSDDEILGCGGTLALLAQKGCAIRVVVVTDGCQGDPLGRSDGDIVAVRRSESRAALGLVGVSDVVFLNEPDGQFFDSRRFQARMATLLEEYDSDWLFLPSVLDYHRDHVALGLAVMSCWNRRGRRERAFLYEVWAPLPATCVVDITGVVERKRDALNCYQSQLAYRDYRTAILGLAAYRGLYCAPTPEPRHAEAFLEMESQRYLLGFALRLLRLRFHVESLLNRG